MRQFCYSEFWNLNLTWNTPDPDFTPCFHKTVLVLGPAAFLWLLLPLELYLSSKSNSRKIPWSWVNISRIGFASALTILAIIELAHYIYLDMTLPVISTGLDPVPLGLPMVSGADLTAADCEDVYLWTQPGTGGDHLVCGQS